MMVMTTKSQIRTMAAKTVAVDAQPSSLGETAEDVGKVAQRIRAGQAFLKVVAYPWGVEFEVCDQETET